MTDYEILIEFAKKDEGYDKLSEYEKLLCRTFLRDTFAFNVYLLKARLFELLEAIIDSVISLLGKIRSK